MAYGKWENMVNKKAQGNRVQGSRGLFCSMKLTSTELFDVDEILSRYGMAICGVISQINRANLSYFGLKSMKIVTICLKKH